MGEIAVQLEDELVAAFQRPFEAGDISPAQAAFLAAVQYMNRGVLGRQFIGEFASAVGRIVIHYQHVHRGGEGKEPLREREQILALIVRRQNDQGLVHAIRTRG